MEKARRIAVLPGDGIGPEVIAEAVAVMNAAARKTDVSLEYVHRPAGGASIDAFGEPITREAIEVCARSDAILLGAVGGANWDALPLEKRPEAALLTLRKEFGCFANLRPIKLIAELAEFTPFKPSVLANGVDMLIVRELTHGLYYGERGRRRVGDEVEAYDTAAYSASSVERVARLAFRLAMERRRRLTSVDKSNILETSRLWREVVTRVSGDFPDVEVRHQLVDSAAMRLLISPSEFDVVLINNEFGDILSDEASVLAGSLGMIPSAALGDKPPYFFEPIHGSAPDIAGKGIANPIGAILTAALLFRYGLRNERGARMIEAAVNRAIEAGCRTKDIAHPGECVLSTREMGQAVADAILAA